MRKLLLGSLVLVVLLAVWLLQQSPGEPKSGPTLAATGSAGGATTAEHDGDGQHSATTVPEAQPTARAAAEPANAPHLLTIRVVKESGGPGVSGVQVRLIDTKAPENAAYLALRRDFVRDRETDAEGFGAVAMTGADGRVRFPRPESGSLFARLDELYAEEGISWHTPDELEVLLKLDLELRALVLDADDRPVMGAQVGWLQWSGDLARNFIQARSGADGVARLRHLQTRLPPQAGLRHTIALGMPGGIAGEVPFDPEHLPSQPVVLRLPASGSLTVTVLDPDRQAFPDGMRVFVQPARTEELKRNSWSGEYRPSLRDEDGCSSAVTVNGVAHFPRVGIGLRLEVFAYHPESRDYFGHEYDALSAAGEHRDIVLQLAESPTVLTARLLRLDRSPIANARPSPRLVTGGTTSGSPFDTDADGRFRLSVNESTFPPEPERGLWIVHTDTGVEGMQLARVPLPLAFGAGDQDLGEIVLGEGGVIAAGRVVDEAGVPMAGVRLGLRRLDWDPGSDAPDLPRGRRNTDQTSEDGRFGILGAAAGRRWELSFMREGWERELREVESGATDMTVILRPSARRSLGHVLLDPGIERDLLEWRLTRKDGQGVPSLHLSHEPGGGITVAGSAEGELELRLLARRSNEELARLTGLTLAPGVPQDPRLDPLDLRGRIFSHSVLVTGPDGRQPGKLAIAFGSEDQFVSDYWTNPVRFATALPNCEITIYGPGAAAKTLRLSGGDAEVRLEAGIPVRWEWIVEGVGESGLTLGLRLRLLGRGYMDQYSVQLDSSGKGSGTLPVPGTYSLVLEYQFVVDSRTKTFTSEGDALNLDGGTEFVVSAGTEPVVIPFRLREQALEKARRRIADF